MSLDIQGVDPLRIAVLISNAYINITEIVDAKTGITIWEQPPIEASFPAGSPFAIAGLGLYFGG